MIKIMVKSLFLGLMIFLCPSSYGQEELSNKQREFRIDALGPALIFEQRLVNNLTLALDGSAITRLKSNLESKKSKLTIKPYLRIEPRYYTKILLKNDHSSQLRGEFISFQSIIGPGTKSGKPWQTFGPVIGQTSNLGKKGYVHGSIGYGILHSVGDLSGTFLIDLGLGLAF